MSHDQRDRTRTSTRAARLELAAGVRLLHPEDAVLRAMLSGWAKQQLGGRRLERKTIESRERTIVAFVAFTNEYPWRWTASQVDEWTTHLMSERRLARSTIRSYQGAVRLFCDYLISPYYGWAQECLQRFGTHPTQVCHEWNTAAHLVEYEGRPGRRPLTRDEVQRLFDHADDRVERAVRLGRKGALAAYRDATVLKTIYGWGLRCTEVSRLDLGGLLPQSAGGGVGPVWDGARAVRQGHPRVRAATADGGQFDAVGGGGA